MTRGQRGRQIGQAMIALAVVVIFATAFLFLTAPGNPHVPMMGRPLWMYAVSALGIIVGLVWMVRIYRADPEPDQHAWRYRAKR